MNQCVYLWRESERSTPGEDIRPFNPNPFTMIPTQAVPHPVSSSFILMTESFHYYQKKMKALPAHASHMLPCFLLPDLRWKYRSWSLYPISRRKPSSGYYYSERVLQRHQLCLLYFSVRVWLQTTFDLISTRAWSSKPCAPASLLQSQNPFRNTGQKYTYYYYYRHRHTHTHTTHTHTHTHTDPSVQFSFNYYTSVIPSRLDAENSVCITTEIWSNHPQICLAYLKNICVLSIHWKIMGSNAVLILTGIFYFVLNGVRNLSNSLIH